MKKTFFTMCVAALMFTSCSTIKQSATTQKVANEISSSIYAEMAVAPQKITYTYYPSAEIRRGGLKNCINAAIRQALKENGDADVLIQNEEAVVERKGFFGRKIKSVTVSGYPANYTKFINEK